MFKMPEYVFNEYVVDYRYYGKRVLTSHLFCDEVGVRRSIGDIVFVLVNGRKREAVIKGIV